MMTTVEKAKKILEQGNCEGIECDGRGVNECPLWDADCESLDDNGNSYQVCIDICRKVVQEAEGDSPPVEALHSTDVLGLIANLEKRIAVLEGQKGIAPEPPETSAPIVFNDAKAYTFFNHVSCYILIGIGETYSWRNLRYTMYYPGGTWNGSFITGQEALDSVERDGIKVWDNADEAVNYFFKHRIGPVES